MLPAGSLEAVGLQALRFQTTAGNIVGALQHKL
jgi:hypothetical protein